MARINVYRTVRAASEEAVRNRFVPPDAFRIAQEVPRGRVRPGKHPRSHVFVLNGKVKFSTPQEVELNAGDAAEVPECSYTATVDASAAVDMIWVWRLPPEFVRRDKD